MKNLLLQFKSLDKLQTLITISAVIGVYLFFNSLFTNTISPRIKKLEEENIKLISQIEVNNNKINELYKNIEEKDAKINELENNDKELQQDYDKNNDELKKLRKKYEKINSVDKYNSDELKGYFSNEYEK
jgi:peptidoglycan hydrolase CwlO-like protein